MQLLSSAAHKTDSYEIETFYTRKGSVTLYRKYGISLFLADEILMTQYIVLILENTLLFFYNSE